MILDSSNSGKKPKKLQFKNIGIMLFDVFFVIFMVCYTVIKGLSHKIHEYYISLDSINKISVLEQADILKLLQSFYDAISFFLLFYVILLAINFLSGIRMKQIMKPKLKWNIFLLCCNTLLVILSIIRTISVINYVNIDNFVYFELNILKEYDAVIFLSLEVVIISIMVNLILALWFKYKGTSINRKSFTMGIMISSIPILLIAIFYYPPILIEFLK